MIIFQKPLGGIKQTIYRTDNHLWYFNSYFDQTLYGCWIDEGFTIGEDHSIYFEGRSVLSGMIQASYHKVIENIEEILL